ncbi:hypothetical protein [Horticoccus sp. 23ND18S-11]|uniref:hypothetical protein n=1 Tax=Horticoccus sp. 23ND18S-11 TaxID=3391832 RepID=UPI0039C8EDF1
MKLNIPDRQRWLVIVAGACVALLILEYWVRAPLFGLWQAHSLDIAKLQKNVTVGRSTISRAAQIERRWLDMQSNALPKDPAQAEQDVISAFDRWGRANNIELSSIRPQWKRGSTDKYSLLECRVDATGTIPTLSHFIYELEHSPLALRVDAVELTSRDDNGQKLTLGLIVSGLRLSPLERKLQ